jgi:hypothetical protein
VAHNFGLKGQQFYKKSQAQLRKKQLRWFGKFTQGWIGDEIQETSNHFICAFESKNLGSLAHFKTEPGVAHSILPNIQLNTNRTSARLPPAYEVHIKKKLF